jgi:hypothetical protein
MAAWLPVWLHVCQFVRVFRCVSFLQSQFRASTCSKWMPRYVTCLTPCHAVMSCHVSHSRHHDVVMGFRIDVCHLSVVTCLDDMVTNICKNFKIIHSHWLHLPTPPHPIPPPTATATAAVTAFANIHTRHMYRTCISTRMVMRAGQSSSQHGS